MNIPYGPILVVEDVPNVLELLEVTLRFKGYPVVTARLQAGDLVLFYTDGLVERRGDDVLEQVKRILSAVSAEPAADVLVRLRDRLHTPSADDDTCALAVRVGP